ncbi:DNA alkylation repair protein [Actinoplanes campanulatus]|nr:DNA alkylation repair protein [Actinoplanes capillaceus]
MSDLAVVLVDRLAAAFDEARDPVRAVGAAAYMRDQFPFLGLTSPVRRARARVALAGRHDRPRPSCVTWRWPAGPVTSASSSSSPATTWRSTSRSQGRRSSTRWPS